MPAASTIGAGRLRKNKNVAPGVEPGSFVMVAGGSTPEGYLRCDGASLATATYPDLFAAIGYTWGGSGANFNVPDSQSKFLRGNSSVAGTGGAFSGSGVGSHQHYVSGYGTQSTLSKQGTGQGVSNFDSYSYPFSDASGGGSRTLGPPHIGVNWYIKT